MIRNLTNFRRHKLLNVQKLFFSSTQTDIKSFNIFNPTEEHASLREMLRNFVESEVDPQALEHNRKEIFNVDLFKKLGDLGLLGITVDPEYGGSGMDAVAAVIAHGIFYFAILIKSLIKIFVILNDRYNFELEELSAADPAFCLSYLAHSMLFVNNLARNGNHEQKLKYLPSACTGEKVCGMGMSEPGVGTDVLGMSTMASKSSDGSYYTLNGAKMWITNGTVDGKDTGDVFLVYAKTDLNKKNGGLTSFLVEKGMSGFSLGQKIEDKCGMRASMTAELVFSDVKVPTENIVGEVGGATLCMMRNLEIERITLAAMSLGIARRSIEVMSNYSQERKAFGKSLADFGQVNLHLGNFLKIFFRELNISYLLSPIAIDSKSHR